MTIIKDNYKITKPILRYKKFMQISVLNRILKSKSGNYFVLNIFSIISTITSLLGQIIIASKLGVNFEYDAYLAAFVIPNFLISVATSYVGINTLPILSEIENKGGDNEQISRFLTTTLVYVLLFSLLIIMLTNTFSKYIFIAILPGWSLFKIELVNKLYLIISASFLFSALSNILTEIANYHKKFVIPAIAPTFLGGIFPAILLLMCYKSLGVYALAIGFLIFTIINFTILLVFFSLNYSFKIEINNTNSLKVIKNSILLTFSGFLSKIQPLLENFYCSFLPSGSISIIGYAKKMVLIPANMISQNFINIIYQEYARAAGKGNDEELFKTFANSFKILSLLLIFIAFFLASVGKEFIKLFLQRGKFNEQQTNLLYLAVLGYLGYFIFSGLGGVSSRVFYAKNKNFFPIILSISGIILYSLLMHVFSKLYGVIGVPIALSLQFIFANILTYIFMTFHLGIKLNKLLTLLLKYFLILSFVYLITNTINLFRINTIYLIVLKAMFFWGVAIMTLFLIRDETFTYVISKFKKSYEK